MTADEFWSLACSLPLVVEGTHKGHRAVRVGMKAFATATTEDGVVAVRLDRAIQDEMIVVIEGTWPAPDLPGRKGWTHVDLATASDTDIRDLLELGWTSVTPRRLLHLMDEEDA